MPRSLSLTPQFVSAFLLIMASPVAAQSASPYDEDLSAISGELRSVSVLVGTTKIRSTASASAIDARLLALSKRLHRIEEEALSTALEQRRAGQRPSRNLVYAAAVSRQLDTAQSMLDAYLDEPDPTLMNSYNAAMRSARELLAAQ